MVGRDQCRVIGNDLALVTPVVEVDQLDLAAEQAARRVDVVHPELVALQERLAVGGEVAGSDSDVPIKIGFFVWAGGLEPPEPPLEQAASTADMTAAEMQMVKNRAR